ncbi:hypothetical protein AB0L13_44910 [Saccharopolyspora shandongensis]|uniref:hypothetical protein n=1 Tax=Saccharopolyspora shandongensis TaxID=418495 RepID=UPI003426B113
MFKINRMRTTGILSLPRALGVAGLASNRFWRRKPASKARHRRDRTATLWRTEGVGKPHIFLIKSTDGTANGNITSTGPAARFEAM